MHYHPDLLVWLRIMFPRVVRLAITCQRDPLVKHCILEGHEFAVFELSDLGAGFCDTMSW